MLLDFEDKKFNINIYPKSLHVYTSRGIVFWSDTQAAYVMIPKSYFLTLLHVCRFILQHTSLWMEPRLYFPRSLASFVPSSWYKVRLWGHSSRNLARTSQQEKCWPPWADDATRWLTWDGGSCTWLRKNTGGPGLEGKAITSEWPVFTWKSMSHFSLKLEIESKTKLPSQTQF